MISSEKRAIIDKVKDAGVVGAGGAGFPTYIKIDNQADTIIANIAECEPLLYKDKEIVRNYPLDVISGIKTVMEVTGAKKGIIGIKKKYKNVIEALERNITKNISIFPLGDYYPAGDEIVLTYDVTGKIVPEGEIPLKVGILVSNAETLYNISKAVKSIPVTKKFITISGAIKKPMTLRVPVGTTIKEIMEILKVKYENLTIFLDGLMMGEVAKNIHTSVTKRTSGIILLPSNHPVVLKRTRDVKYDIRIIKSACDQCSYCTEFCPRYLIGHSVEPHRVMRSLSLSNTESFSSIYAQGCVECSLCTLFACPEELSPDIIMKKSLQDGKKFEQVASKKGVHPMREFRKVPSTKLLKRLSIENYNNPALLSDLIIEPDEVRLPLMQHIGEPAKPIKLEGDKVIVGELIAETEKDKPGTKIHASISGTIAEINETEIIISSRRL